MIWELVLKLSTPWLHYTNKIYLHADSGIILARHLLSAKESSNQYVEKWKHALPLTTPRKLPVNSKEGQNSLFKNPNSPECTRAHAK